MKKLDILFFLIALSISSCDSIHTDSDKKVINNKDEKSAQEIVDSIKSTEIVKTFIHKDSIVKSDIDFYLVSNIKIRIDKNEVEWKEKEQNKFRFVYKVKNKKLIVYQNEGNEFKTYLNPKIYVNAEYCCSDFDSIVVSGRTILYKSLLNVVNFAPYGKGNSPNYFEGEIGHKSLLETL